jgi:succinate dehydrogenase / fumarate reductase, cytochrome b subunit
MEKTLGFIDTTIGKKLVVAVTGFILYGFVIIHMLGNLQVFLGPEVFNGYAATLKSNAAILWGARSVLLGSIVLHVVFTLSLVSRSAGARPVGYRAKQVVASNYAAMTMRYGGPALALYILFHIAHFTFPGIAVGNYRHSHTDVYSNFVGSFSVPGIALLYVVAQVFLGLHLYHGAWSLFQTLGLSHPRYGKHLRIVPPMLGVGVAFGNIIMPLSVLAGIIK